MAGRDVCDLVCHYSRQFGFFVCRKNQAGVHIQEPARYRQSINCVGIDDLDGEWRRVGVARQVLADPIYVVGYDSDIVKGVATYWLEFFLAVSDLDIVYVPIGQGSGICSCSAVRNGLNLRTKIVGVVATGAPAYALSFEAGRIIPSPVSTLLADGMACRIPDEDSLAIVLQNVDHIVQVSEEEIAKAMKICFTDTHNVAEGAGAAGLAAALQEKSALKGKRVGLVITGGNVDHDVFARVLMA